MNLLIEVAECYYRVALIKATRRNLSGAVRFARGACLLNANHANATRLLGLCLHELGTLNTEFLNGKRLYSVSMRQMLSGSGSDTNLSSNKQPGMDNASPDNNTDANQKIMQQVRGLAQRKKWRKAARLALTIPHRNVRVLNIQGCLFACAKQYELAARSFSEALERDCANQLATKGIIECAQRGRRY
jgi:hypothetical protein